MNNMSEYKNGFYAYIPTEECIESMHELSLPQVIQIIENFVWLTGVSNSYNLDYAQALGTIGAMLMDEDGNLTNTKG